MDWELCCCSIIKSILKSTTFLIIVQAFLFILGLLIEMQLKTHRKCVCNRGKKSSLQAPFLTDEMRFTALILTRFNKDVMNVWALLFSVLSITYASALNSLEGKHSGRAQREIGKQTGNSGRRLQSAAQRSEGSGEVEDKETSRIRGEISQAFLFERAEDVWQDLELHQDAKLTLCSLTKLHQEESLWKGSSPGTLLPHRDQPEEAPIGHSSQLEAQCNNQRWDFEEMLLKASVRFRRFGEYTRINRRYYSQNNLINPSPSHPFSLDSNWP